MLAYAMQFTNTQPAAVRATPRAILRNAATGRRVESFGDVVELLQSLPAYDSSYSCRMDWFRVNATGRSYSIGLELEDILEVVRDGGRWQIIERRIGGY